MNTIILTIGDWSGDGHNKYDVYEVYTNFTRDQLVSAYKNSCAKTGLFFIDWLNGPNFDIRDINEICANYKDNRINHFQFEILKRFNCDKTSILNSPCKANDIIEMNDFLKLLLWFISLSLVDFDKICREFRSDNDFDVWLESLFTFKKLSYSEKKDVLDKYPYDSFLNGWWINDLRSGFGYGLYYV